MNPVDLLSRFREKLHLRRIIVAVREMRSMSDVKRQGLLEALLSKEALARYDACEHSPPITININNSTVNILCRTPADATPEPGR